METLYFIIGLGFLVCILLLNLCNIKYYENFSIKKLKKTVDKSVKKGLKTLESDVEDIGQKPKKCNNVFNWPTNQTREHTHTHPTLLYYNADGTILPVKHGHRLTEHVQSKSNYSDTNNNVLLSSMINNASTVKLKGKKNKKKDLAEKDHYSMPLPLDKNNKIIDITKNSNYLSPALWSTVDDSKATGYLYPYNITNRFNKDNIDMLNPYGVQVTNKLKYENPTAMKYFNGIKHTHKCNNNNGTAKGAWHLKKRSKKNVDNNVTKDMCVYQTVDSSKYTVVRDGKKKRDKAINSGTTERTLTNARSLVNDDKWLYCARDDDNSTDTSCVCLPGSCSYNSYGGAGGKPLNACIYQGTCTGSSPTCDDYSDTAGTTGNKGSCEGAGCTWNYTNKDCSTYEDTYTNQDTCTSYNTGTINTDEGAAETSCTSNPWCYWGT